MGLSIHLSSTLTARRGLKNDRVTIKSQTRLIRHFRLIRQGNLNMLKALSLTPMLNHPLNSSPRLVHRKISTYFSDELSGSNCTGV